MTRTEELEKHFREAWAEASEDDSFAHRMARQSLAVMGSRIPELKPVVEELDTEPQSVRTIPRFPLNSTPSASEALDELRELIQDHVAPGVLDIIEHRALQYRFAEDQDQRNVAARRSS
jgi:hypothetical protein